MPEVPIYTSTGDALRSESLRDDVFGINPHAAVLHQAVLRQLADARQGTHATKTRGEVAGGGRKPWRQKGTGRARQGSRRAPQWRGGGVVFGPHPRDYRQRMPKQMRRLALKSAFASKAADGHLLVLESLQMDAPSTKQFKALLDRLGVQRSALVLVDSHQRAVQLSARNLPNVKAISPDAVNVVDILKFDQVVLSLDHLRAIEDRLARPARGRGAEPQPVESAEPAAPEEPIEQLAGAGPALGQQRRAPAADRVAAEAMAQEEAPAAAEPPPTRRRRAPAADRVAAEAMTQEEAPAADPAAQPAKPRRGRRTSGAAAPAAKAVAEPTPEAAAEAVPVSPRRRRRKE